MTISLPPGCKCKPYEWRNQPQKICNDYLPINKRDQWCAYCGHDEACHNTEGKSKREARGVEGTMKV